MNDSGTFSLAVVLVVASLSSVPAVWLSSSCSSKDPIWSSSLSDGSVERSIFHLCLCFPRFRLFGWHHDRARGRQPLLALPLQVQGERKRSLLIDYSQLSFWFLLFFIFQYHSGMCASFLVDTLCAALPRWWIVVYSPIFLLHFSPLLFDRQLGDRLLCVLRYLGNKWLFMFTFLWAVGVFTLMCTSTEL